MHKTNAAHDSDVLPLVNDILIFALELLTPATVADEGIASLPPA